LPTSVWEFFEWFSATAQTAGGYGSKLLGKAPGSNGNANKDIQLTSAQRKYMKGYDGATRLPNLRQDIENLRTIELLSRRIGDFTQLVD